MSGENLYPPENPEVTACSRTLARNGKVDTSLYASPFLGSNDAFFSSAHATSSLKAPRISQRQWRIYYSSQPAQQTTPSLFHEPRKVKVKHVGCRPHHPTEPGHILWLYKLNTIPTVQPSNKTALHCTRMGNTSCRDNWFPIHCSVSTALQPGPFLRGAMLKLLVGASTFHYSFVVQEF